ncbi:hypothetical protein [Oceaniglobus ichthyenteri]|uniref:hypothetical protein n=1 Tax=Oceaniglobus ichthyenteri TaxID=2136177 RepID=UPI000F82B6EF|nr:hypothetical protein [Oceaniglobus ichthyenteri]
MKRHSVYKRLLAGMIAATLALPVLADPAPPLLDLTRLGGYDAEARKISVTLTRGVRSGRDLPTQSLRTTRERMVDDLPVTIDALRALADAGDGIAALRLIAQLEEEGHSAAPENLAHYYGLAASTGRVVGLFGLVRTLKQVDPAKAGPARLRMLQDIVMAYAKAGNPVASAAMMEFHRTGHPFGPMPGAIAELATAGQGKSNAVIALQLAGDLIQTGWDDPAALARAQTHLRAAETADSVRIKLIAGNLLPVLAARIQTLSPVEEPNG